MEPATKKVSSNWYDEKTGRALAQEAIDHSSCDLKIAFVSTPAAYHDLLKIQREKEDESMGDNIYIFEYDRRFGGKYGDRFCFYDYNAPMDQPDKFHHFFDYVLMEPRCRAAWSIFVRAWSSHT
ncbi:N(6)-adenine-specific DNA methyltransferase 2 [Phytophthora megakarya]|uniref:N(6)-adenine-specific DNA methyltransferase 2 n=1 Tax=Phytophthora megakarya TaxID=4795 RepID=A0A225UMW7_9STRA|nr:N(6)-adenine-specific DNA methyltransferase 2 [Phytophthora megakarya]